MPHRPIQIVATDESSSSAPAEVERERDTTGDHKRPGQIDRGHGTKQPFERERERDRLGDSLEALEIEAIPDRGTQGMVGGEREDVNRRIGNDREAKIEAMGEREDRNEPLPPHYTSP